MDQIQGLAAACPEQTIPKHLPKLAARFDLPDYELRDQAEHAAGAVERLAHAWTLAGAPDDFVKARLRRIAKRHAVRFPNKHTLREIVNRMQDPAWWRRSLRYRFKAVELVAIQRGAVHRRAAPYVSDKTLHRHERHAARTAVQMAALEAVNERTGKAMPMPDLIAASLANPKNRRSAMMVRIKGIEASAKARGHVGLFLTITCPSRMHPRSSKTGEANPVYDGTWPSKANKYLGRVWGRALRAAAHQGIKPFGMRVVEPHHDACPHWHVLAFVPADQAETLISILRDYSLRDSTNEPGAQLRRFTVERIDPTKGSAVGYVAKYVSKSIDGEGVDADTESDDTGRSAARRQVAWARTWDIRQFQFFGVPAITPTREFYKVAGDTLPGQALPELHAACKANDYGAWLAAVAAHGLRLAVDYSLQPSTRYLDETSKAIQGLRIEGGDLGGELRLTTRCDTWRIQPRPRTDGAASQDQSSHAGLCPPWTRINNSASVDLEGFFPDAMPAGVEVWGDADGLGEMSRAHPESRSGATPHQ